jgi:hypothetical protein
MRSIRIILMVLAGLFVINSVYASEIILSTNQSEYYFMTGQQAVIPIIQENTYEKEISGLFTYAITQEMNQQGFSYSSTNTNSKTFTIQPGESTLNANFGTQTRPLDLKVQLTFEYSEISDYIVTMDEIIIHFVERPEDKEQNNQQTQSEQQQLPSEEERQQQMQEEMEREMEEMMREQQQTKQDMLQNSQLNQDSEALKEQLQKEAQEQKEIQEQFKKNVEQNQEFRDLEEKLKEKGFQRKSETINAESNNTGSFEMQYENKEGDTAKIEGEMEDNEMKDIQKQSSDEKDEMLERLKADKRFQAYEERLMKKGFNHSKITWDFNKNITDLNMEYKKGNQTSNITAEFLNLNITKIELREHDDREYLWLLAVLALLGITVAIFYNRLHRKNIEGAVRSKREKPFNYIRESKRLIEQAKQLYIRKHYKDAYGTAAQGLRLYLSYKHKLKKEITNDKLIKYLKDKKIPAKEIKECFDLCSLVEFAKYEANKKDFDRIIKIEEKIIS